MSPPTSAFTTSDLLGLATAVFGVAQPMGSKLLGAVDKRFFDNVRDGTVANYSDGDDSKNDPVQGDTWDGARAIQADRIIWLCRDADAKTLVTDKGIQIQGARIERALDLGYARVPFPVLLVRCAVASPAMLDHAEFRGLDLSGTHVKGISARGIKIGANLVLADGFQAYDPVQISGARVGGNIVCSGGRFRSADRAKAPALVLDNMVCQGSLSLVGAIADGTIRICLATVGGELDCSGAKLTNVDQDALVLDGITLGGDLSMKNGFESSGEVRLVDATIHASIACSGGKFRNCGRDALSMDRSIIMGSVFLDKQFESQGEVRMLGVVVRGSVFCGQGKFHNCEGDALSMDGIDVKLYMCLNDRFESTGTVRAPHGRVGQDLRCDGGQFSNVGKTVLILNSAQIKGSLYFDAPFKSQGAIQMLATSITGNLNCRGVELCNPTGEAIHCENMKVRGDVIFSSKRQGDVQVDPRIEGTVNFRGASIGGSFVWKGFASTDKLALDLRSATVGNLADDEQSWPQAGKLHVHNFHYDEIDDDSILSYRDRVGWLQLQPLSGAPGRTGRRPLQPYNHLATVFRRQGHEEHARQVLIHSRQDVQFRRRPYGIFRSIVNHLYRYLVGYGYSPWRAAFWIAPMVVLGTIFFQFGYDDGVMTPTRSDPRSTQPGQITQDYPQFSSFMYSLDTLIPLVNFSQREYWLPSAERGSELISHPYPLRSGQALRCYMWIHIAVGWVLAAALAAGLTNSMRRST